MKHKSLLFSLLLLLAPCSLPLAMAQPLSIPGVQEMKSGRGSVAASSVTSVGYSDASLRGVAEYLARAWEGSALPSSFEKKGSPSSIFFSLKAESRLGDEGYRLTISPKGITIQAATMRGALWGAQTLLQMKDLSQDGTLPCLTISDAPDYPLRGLVLDVARKFIPMDYLYSLVGVMSYYKMNTLHIHLNDNGFKEYFHDNWDETYAAFRMESDLFPALTAIDGHYTKQEMRDLIRYAESMGVEIIPEIDAPAHSLAFSRLRPSLSSEEFGADHLNLRSPEVIPFLDSLYAEYLGGPDPVFTGPRFHIGTDEYSNADPAVVELFRELIVHLCQTVKSYGKQPVLWGSLTHAKGTTPVPSDGVLMSMWYNGYADPREMHHEGFHMISVPDGLTYIVPEAGYYYNYLNQQYLYQHWEPAKIGNQQFAHQDPLIDGGMFALWNDVVGNGISVGDVHHRLLPAIQVIAEKTWHAEADSTDAAFHEWQQVSQRLGDGPLTDEIGRKGEWQLGYPYAVEFDIDWADEAPGTVLMSSPRSTFYLADPIRGMLGFARDGYLFTFRHRGQAGRHERLRIEGDNKGTALYADGRLVERLDPDVQLRTGGKNAPYRVMRTLMFPLQKKGDYKSKVTNFKAQPLH